MDEISGIDWYNDFYPMIKKLVKEKMGSPYAVEEIFQESILVVFEKANAGKLNVTSKLSTYLYGIAENKCKEFLRKEKKHETVDYEGDEPEDELDAKIYNDDSIEALRKCIDKLPELRKKIVLDYYYRKYNMNTIAERNHCVNSDSAKSQKYKAIRDLKLCMDASIKTLKDGR
jgi:RNA polymerase sigma factor (sigma-70 family)